MERLLSGKTMSTPWGKAQQVYEYPNGIRWVSTASHGGFWVPAKLVDRIPAAHRAYASQWSGSEQWYEEDCAWAAVVLAFPELARNPEELETAKQTADYWIDKKGERVS